MTAAPANIRRRRNGWRSWRVLILLIACGCFAGALFAQAGRHAHPTNEASSALNVVAVRADVDKLEAAAQEFAYEIFDGDKLLIVGYDNSAEIVADWTDDAKKIETELKLFRKKGDPHLFDAIIAVTNDALQPLSAQKRAIVVISDGLDRGSETKFNQTLKALQALDIVVYCVQAPDRTRGAIRRDVPKPKQVIDQLARSEEHTS